MAEALQLSEAIVAFTRDGTFPDDVSLPPVSQIDLQPTIDALDEAKTELEVGQPQLRPTHQLTVI